MLEKIVSGPFLGADGGSECAALTFSEDRLDIENIRKMHAAVKGVVYYVHVFGMHFSAEAFNHDIQGRRNRAEMCRQRKPLCD